MKSYDRSCDNCGLDFLAKRVDGRFCSKKCHVKWHSKNREYVNSYGERTTWYKNYYKKNKETIDKKNLARLKFSQKRNREYVLKYKQNPCTRCRIDYHPIQLDFHHYRDKDNTISNMVRNGVSIKKLEKEILKCVLLCANCHRLTHWEEKNDIIKED